MGPKKQDFWPRINCSQMKLPNFESPSSDSSSKFGRYFSNKVVLKLKSAKNAFYKKGVLKLIFFNENLDDFWHSKFTLNVQNWHFLTPDGDSKFGNFIRLQLILGQKPCLCRVPDHEIPLPKLIYCTSVPLTSYICD